MVKYKYSDFLAVRAVQSMWVTRNISYRIGAVIAWMAAELRLSPNFISIMSVVVTVGSALYVGIYELSPILQWLVLILGLQVGYGLDCADGPLARVTGQSSSFGSVLDKLCDMTSAILLLGALSLNFDGQREFLSQNNAYTYWLIIIVIACHIIFNLTVWLKEIMISQADRLMEDPRNRNLVWHLKKCVGIYLDEPVYRLGIAVSWLTGYFWEFMIIYHIPFIVILLIYIIFAKKDLDLKDLKTKKL